MKVYGTYRWATNNKKKPLRPKSMSIYASVLVCVCMYVCIHQHHLYFIVQSITYQYTDCKWRTSVNKREERKWWDQLIRIMQSLLNESTIYRSLKYTPQIHSNFCSFFFSILINFMLQYLNNGIIQTITIKLNLYFWTPCYSNYRRHDFFWLCFIRNIGSWRTDFIKGIHNRHILIAFRQ